MTAVTISATPPFPTQRPPAVPFFRPALNDEEIGEVVACLRSGWLTTGPRAKQFEEDFARFVGAAHAVSVNSCTAALHLAVEALGLGPGDAVLVPTMTFAATAEVVRYQGAVPILVDCDPITLNMDLTDATRKVEMLNQGMLGPEVSRLVGMIPVHVGGNMLDMDAVKAFAAQHGLWVIEDAAHALPAGYRSSPDLPWRYSGANTADVTCFSFYANKTITTGEGGMAVTADPRLASRMRQMSLHGLSQDAWRRFSHNSSWDYRILVPGFKYNLTDVAAALGIHQLRRAEILRREREALALTYSHAFSRLSQLELPPWPANRLLSWHLYPVRLCLDRLAIDRNTFIAEMRDQGVGCSVHWRPLHLHPYYADLYPEQCHLLPVATAVWEQLVSLPVFPAMREDEIERVIEVVAQLCRNHARAS